MADNTNKLIGQNYTTPDLVAKVTGNAKYAEDYKVDGMLWTKLLLSPTPHARITRMDLSAALAMPGVKAIVTADDLPEAQAGGTLGENGKGEQQRHDAPQHIATPVCSPVLHSGLLFGGPSIGEVKRVWRDFFFATPFPFVILGQARAQRRARPGDPCLTIGEGQRDAEEHAFCTASFRQNRSGMDPRVRPEDDERAPVRAKYRGR